MKKFMQELESMKKNKVDILETQKSYLKIRTHRIVNSSLNTVEDGISESEDSSIKILNLKYRKKKV